LSSFDEALVMYAPCPSRAVVPLGWNLTKDCHPVKIITLPCACRTLRYVGETWRVLEVTHPDGWPAHDKVQEFYFGEHVFLLRRLN
jgi:hypothetical protein